MVGLHLNCTTIVPCRWSPSLGRATEFSFEPTLSNERKRRLAIRGQLVEGLRYAYHMFSDDILNMIAGFLECEFAATTAAHLWLRRGSADCAVDTSRSIWAGYVNVDGVRYLTSLSNKEGHRLECILGAHQRFNAVYVLEDHVGIRRIEFARPDSNVDTPTLEDALMEGWWRTLPASRVLRATSDVGLL